MMVLAVALLSLAGPEPLGVACPDGTARRSHRDGRRLTSEWCARPNGLKHGPAVDYYPNGQAIAVASFREGAQDGAVEYFFNDGALWRRDEWTDGELTREWVDPRLSNLSPSELARRGGAGSAGVVTTSCLPGDKRPACRPLPQPLYRRIAIRLPDGRIAKGTLWDGERDGHWTVRYPSGRIAKRVEYSTGTLASSYAEWYENGRPKAKGEYLSGRKVGIWTFWTELGDKTRQDFSKR